MNAEILDVVVGRFLQMSEDDWTPACALSFIVQRVGVAIPTDNREVCMTVVREGVGRGWFRVGQLTRGAGFVPWTGSDLEVISRVAAAWPIAELPTLESDPCWFDGMAAGREHLVVLRQKVGDVLDDVEGYGYFRMTMRSLEDSKE
jgi:hypothetical protein